MADRQVPRVMLPGMAARRPLTPGPNSWAQDQASDSERDNVRGNEQNESTERQPTNRDKYENKPLPDPSDESARAFFIPPKDYIQPAIPLVKTPQTRHKKNRSVTEPVQTKLAATAKKPNVSQLARKFSSQKNEENLSALPPNVSEKALHLLGLQQKTPPVSAPSRAKTPDQYRHISDETPSTVKGPVRQMQTTSLPSRPSSSENHGRVTEMGSPQLAPQLSVPEEPFQEQLDTINSELEHKESMNHLRLPKIPMYGNAGKAVVHQNALHPSESFRGIIETASLASRDDHSLKSIESGETRSGMIPIQRQPSGETLQPTVYSPDYAASSYGGVWENDPAVGSTLPPFTPGPRPQSQDPEVGLQSSKTHSDRSNHDRYDAMSQAHSSYSEPKLQWAYQSHYPVNGSQPSLPSTNSWASRSRGPDAHFASSSATPISAVLPPQWPQHIASTISNNHVPSPPPTQHDYQRSNALSAGFAQLDMTLHHHIDSIFCSLSRQLTEKHDRIIDQIVLRLEKVEDNLTKGTRGIKDDVRIVKKDVAAIRTRLSEDGKSNADITQLLRTLSANVEGLDSKIERYRSQTFACITQYMDSRDGRHEVGHQYDQQSALRAPVGGMHTPFDAGIEQHQAQRSPSKGIFGRTSSRTRQSESSSKGHRSRRSTTSTSQTGDRHSNTSNDRAYNININAHRANVKSREIKECSAYGKAHSDASQKDGANQNASLRGLAAPSSMQCDSGLQRDQISGGGWYEQAYGQGP